jgi:CRP-like cAMP-binding protein
MTVQYAGRNAPNGLSPAISARWRRHPFVTRLRSYIDAVPGDLDTLWHLIEADLTVKKRRDLVVDGYEYRKLCFVEEGFAARYKLLHNGKRQIINLVMPGDVVGMPGAFLEKAPYSVIAVTDMQLQMCPIDAYFELCYRRPLFGLALSMLAVHEAIICGEHVINTGRRTPAERLAHLLLEIYSRLAMAGRASQTRFDLPFSQEIMSDALGLSVPHLNRTMARLRADGLIKVNGRCIELADIEALEMLGQFQPVNLTRVPLQPGLRRAM